MENYFGKDFIIGCNYWASDVGIRMWEEFSEDTIKNDLAGVLTLPQKIDIFQIDDGFQEYVGDWFRLNKKKFPNGLKPIIDEVKANDKTISQQSIYLHDNCPYGWGTLVKNGAKCMVIEKPKNSIELCNDSGTNR